ncbi:glycoside hydrolase family 32 protein [Roseateles saccharophilus]|uniref:Fructan beta-fructosidase n=1 Tax=Roseateles saccharophilus TaxID=304 RepID=A0A4V2VSF9_ROSSA|nr:glycoside hydrolase family 32 protein [Roseateles saccharophilus]TCV02250.1 fructan beta-fructosidase [Roseateles saccharophilus]
MKTIPSTSQDCWRPALHFTAERFWINDPNGLVFAGGQWHLFFQHNPQGNTWGHMSWGHAVSDDLLHWRHLPLAIPEDESHMAFSGSVVIDDRGSSGLGADGQAPFVAIYTACAQQPVRHQAQHLAFSSDGGVRWTQYAGNPVLDIGAQDFRDPKVFWHESSGRWVMVVVLPHERKASFYASPDLRHWSHLSDFGPAGGVEGIWECPDLISVPVQGQPGRRAWVLKVDAFEGHPTGGSGAQVFVGDFDGSRFRATQPARWVDHGSDFYAAICWAHVPAEDGRAVWLGWMNNHRYAAATPTQAWCGAMSIPRRLSVRDDAGALVLCQEPVAELATARRERWQCGPFALGAGGVDEVVRLGAGDVLDLEIAWRPGTATEFGLLLRCGGQEATRVGWDAERRALFVDRSLSGLGPDDPVYRLPQYAPLAPQADGRVVWRVLLDRCSVELFADGGAVVLTNLIFPSPESLELRAFVRGGSAELLSLECWALEA